MERKLIKQGGGGYTIYLPKKWVEKKKLKAGDLVKISETDTSLIIGSEISGKKETTIVIDENNEHHLKHMLTHAYRKGYDTIIIKTKEHKHKREVRTIAQNILLGFEVTSVENEKIILENISEPSVDKYETILRKVFLVIRETQEFVSADITKGEYLDLNEINELRDQGDKFVLFCRRLLIKEKYEKNINLEWELLTFLMHIQHAYYYLYEYAYKNKLKLSKEKKLNEFLKVLVTQFGHYEEAYLKKDINKVSLISKDKHCYEEILKEIEKNNGKSAVIYSYIKEIFRLIKIGTSPIVSMNI